MYLNDLATIPANLAGVPGISVPSGLADEDGLPAGFQILAPALADDRLYRVGAALEAALADALGRRRCSTVPQLRPLPDHWRVRMTPTATLVDCDDVLAAYDPALGLEVHVELNTQLQDVLRLPDGVRRRAEHAGLPDLPRAARRDAGRSTRKAVESAIRIGLALNCEIAEWCRFARKNYFYPDMPKNFQTSQYDEPIAFEGYMDVEIVTDDGRRPSASRSSARTWRRTPASRCTSAAPPAGSTARSTRWSTTTGPASR